MLRRHVVRAIAPIALLAAVALPLVGRATSSASVPGASTPQRLVGSPIKHVVVIFQENHSFNDMLGKLCVDEGNRCDGTTVGEISDGTQMPLTHEKDIAPPAGHLYSDQVAAINGGAMNGWDKVSSCSHYFHYECLAQVQPGGTPSLWALADSYTISDRTFQTASSASWGSHIELVTGTTDNFVGDPYFDEGGVGISSNACIGTSDASWWQVPYQTSILVPACVPDKAGNGPYRASPVQYVPTIMDSLEAAGKTWRIYAPGHHGSGGFGWAICPTFYECISTGQATNVVQPGQFARDASTGNLPSVSILIPYPKVSQHNSDSLIRGDNWIAKNVAAVMGSPSTWSSTAIFITYDDCGCLYDPVPPPSGFGIRAPMVIVSPWAKPNYVDHTDASFASMLAFIEHTFGLPALGTNDQHAYDYSNAFDFADPPRPPIRLIQHPVPHSSIVYLSTHHLRPGDDPT